jgi:hypothetical protein
MVFSRIDCVVYRFVAIPARCVVTAFAAATGPEVLDDYPGRPCAADGTPPRRRPPCPSFHARQAEKESLDDHGGRHRVVTVKFLQRRKGYMPKPNRLEGDNPRPAH